MNCLIKHVEWRLTPKKIRYKLSEEAKVQEGGPDQIQEFGIGSTTRYVRAKVQIDRSPDRVRLANYNREPEWSEETVWLKYLVEGETNLYSYRDMSIKRHFFQKKDEMITQLIAKTFLLDGMHVRYNYGFRLQLWKHHNCNNFPFSKFEIFPHDEDKIIEYFLEENACLNHPAKNYAAKQKRDALNLKIAPGVRYTYFDLQYPNSSFRNITFEQETSFRLGMELEYIFPFQKNKWGIYIEPSYQSYQSEVEWNNGNVTADYKSMEFALGLRHYFYLTRRFSLYLNGGLIMESEFGESGLSYEDNPTLNFEFDPYHSWDAGLGLKLDNKWSIEVRYLPRRRITRILSSDATVFRGFTGIVGFTFL